MEVKELRARLIEEFKPSHSSTYHPPREPCGLNKHRPTTLPSNLVWQHLAYQRHEGAGIGRGLFL
jgi:hypothetical protein